MASAVLAAATLGCGGGGGNTAHLQGTVTIGGQPVPSDATGHISFIPTGKGQAPAASATIVNSKFDCPAVPQGAVKVSFSITQASGPTYTTDRGQTAQAVESLVPEKSVSGVDLEVTGDNAEQNFDL